MNVGTEIKIRWLAFFDILGFKQLIREHNEKEISEIIVYRYQDALNSVKILKNLIDYRAINFVWFSDSFIFYSDDDSPESFYYIQLIAEKFFEKMIMEHFPIRGSLTIGEFYADGNQNIFLGQALVDAYEYAEDQDWIGLILTPMTIQRLGNLKVLPFFHYSENDIPMRKCKDRNVLAYTMCLPANFENPLLRPLSEMKNLSDERYHPKYERTIKFIQKHHKWMK